MREYIVEVNDSSEMYAVEMGRYEELREVIRCKDCKAFNGLNCVRNNMIAVRTDDYCSRAERKEE